MIHPVILDIVEVSQRSGIPASALRFYEEKKLIASVGRRGLRRLFTADVIDRLSLIALGQNAGFSLDEIRRIFAGNRTLRINKALLAAKADELDQKIKQLTAMRNSLRHAANCPAASHIECPTFRRMLNIAGKKRPAGQSKTRQTF